MTKRDAIVALIEKQGFYSEVVGLRGDTYVRRQLLQVQKLFLPAKVNAESKITYVNVPQELCNAIDAIIRHEDKSLLASTRRVHFSDGPGCN